MVKHTRGTGFFFLYPWTMQAARTDWTIWDDEKPWDSTLVCADELRIDDKWFSHNPQLGMGLIKDTMGDGKHYKNRLVNSTTFHYEVPSKPTFGAERDFVNWLMATGVEVDLLCVGNAFNHHLGQWVVVEAITDPARLRVKYAHRIVLRRLKVQRTLPDVTPEPEKKRFRSGSEARHLDVLRSVLPSGWRVRHEPESISVPQMPLVRDGKRNPWVGDGITIDYVAVSPGPASRRLCIESKSCEADALDEEAQEKCRTLRDKSLVHVLLVYGHGSELRWMDFGDDAAPHDPPTVSSAFPIDL